VILRLLLALLFVAVALRIYLSRRRDPRPLSEWLSIAAFLCVAASMLLSRLSPPFSLALGIVGVLILIGAQVLAGFLKVRR
jgi:FtsH-binding integral membrane protein